MILPSSCWAALGLAGITLAAPVPSLDARTTVAYSTLFPIATRVQSGILGETIAKFNPRLHIASGCQPYTAVNDNGDTSDGRKPAGKSASGCGDTAVGQTYARIGTYNGHVGIMYSWYFLKDQLMDLVTTGAHRHDWENIVVWIDDPATTASPTVLGGGASGHGEYKKWWGKLPGSDDNSPMAEYFASFPTNHELQFTNTVGKTYPISDWGAMPYAETLSLQYTDFGSANVPFKDGNFESNLAKASIF